MARKVAGRREHVKCECSREFRCECGGQCTQLGTVVQIRKDGRQVELCLRCAMGAIDSMPQEKRR